MGGRDAPNPRAGEVKYGDACQHPGDYGRLAGTWSSWALKNEAGAVQDEQCKLDLSAPLYFLQDGKESRFKQTSTWSPKIILTIIFLL